MSDNDVNMLNDLVDYIQAEIATLDEFINELYTSNNTFQETKRGKVYVVGLSFMKDRLEVILERAIG